MKKLLKRNRSRWRIGLIGLLAFLWVLLRSGTNPKRLHYPCQRAALALSANWILAALAFFGSRRFLRKCAKFSAAGLSLAGLVWLILSLPSSFRAGTIKPILLPLWRVESPISKVFVLDSTPSKTGSLASGSASVPDEYLHDPAIDSLMALISEQGIYFHKSHLHPEGLVGADHFVAIKGNFQWDGKNTTNTDRIKGLIWQILEQPDGFTGEILVCDNTQDIGTGINSLDNNSDDPNQSILNVISTFQAKGYPVYSLDWSYIWSTVVSEYSEGNYGDGYVYDAAAKISYPKFRSPSGKYWISLRHGIWDPATSAYDPSRLSIIDFPVLKAHSIAGATAAVKNWIGVMTPAYGVTRYGGSRWHDAILWDGYVAKTMAATFPKLSIIDATWTATKGPREPGDGHQRTNLIVASTDPCAASWYAAKYILTPIADDPLSTNPDFPGGTYGTLLDKWTTILREAGFPCTNKASEISIYGKTGPLWRMYLQVATAEKKAWIVKKRYAKLEVTIEESDVPLIAKYQVYRKEGSGDYTLLKELSSADVRGRALLYDDATIIRSKTYTYQVRGFDSQGNLVTFSNESAFKGS